MPDLIVPKGLIITINDTRLAGHCVSGVKAWFEDYGLDFRTFIREGISAEKFLATGDALAVRIVELKLEREHHG